MSSITDNYTCSVHVIRMYLALAHIEPYSTDFIFRGLTYCNCSNIYVLRKGSKLSDSTASEVSLSVLQSLRLDKSKCDHHSLRVDGASTVASSGITDRMFKKHDQWKC